MIVNSNEEEKSFKALYNKYYKPIYNYIFHQLLNKESTEDITSITFLNALNFIKKKNPRIDNFHAWIYKIATNEILIYRKKNKNSYDLSIDIYNEQILEFIDNNYSKKSDDFVDFIVLYKELDKLNEKERTLITLYFFEKLTYPQISEILKISENTLRPKMSRLLKKLHGNLKIKFDDLR